MSHTPENNDTGAGPDGPAEFHIPREMIAVPQPTLEWRLPGPPVATTKTPPPAIWLLPWDDKAPRP